MSTTVQSATDIRPFRVDIPEEKLAELRRRIAARSYWGVYGPDAPAAGAQPLPPPTIPFGFTTFPGDLADAAQLV